MNSPRPITIAGGGLAGLTLGIGLRRAGIPVTIREAGTYPRNRVCGEFISGQGQEILSRFGLEQRLDAAGARTARTVGFYSAEREVTRFSLSQRTICIPRNRLDSLLASEFNNLGGDLRLRDRCSENDVNEGTIFATGQKARAEGGRWRWFGLRASCAVAASIESDLEMHLLKNGYVGLCRLNDAEVNVCGLFRSRSPESSLARDWRSWLRGPAYSVLFQRLRDAEFAEDSFTATAGLDYHPFRGSDGHRCSIGDRLTLIAPISGNGMSLAIESGELAITPLTNYAAGRNEWGETVEQIRRAAKARFRSRVWIAYALQKILCGSGTKQGAIQLLGRCPWLIRLLFASTR